MEFKLVGRAKSRSPQFCWWMKLGYRLRMCRRHCISSANFCKFTAKFGGTARVGDAALGA